MSSDIARAIMDNMKIIIAGYGLEGISNLIYFRRKFLDAEFVVADERPADKLPAIPDDVKLVTGKSVFQEQLDDADLVVRTASLPPRNIETCGKVWSATNEFFQECPAPIIGVTGTKGKGTTCSLIASILQQAGRAVHLVGNIGVPALDVLPKIKKDDIVVYELSSFQLWDLEKSPHIAVVLMIEPDHLNVHADFVDYLNAKKNIRRHQQLGDVCLYHPTNKYAQEVAATPLGKSNGAKCGHGDTLDFAQRYAIPNDDQVYVKDGYFCVQNRQICSTSHLRLPGVHNLENACAAMSAVTELNIEVTNEQYAKGLEGFTGLPHRLKFVAEKDGIKYYDDSISTTPGSAIAALRSFTESKILIIGGAGKGADYAGLAQEIAIQNMRAVILIGSNVDELAEVLCRQKVICEIVKLGMATMTGIIEAARRKAQSGDVVILSPAAASFDQYKNYVDRGDQFVSSVKAL